MYLYVTEVREEHNKQLNVDQGAPLSEMAYLTAGETASRQRP